MLKRLLILAALCCAGVLGLSGVALAQATNPVAINNTGWTSLGIGPLSVSALGPEWPNIALVQSSTSSCTGLGVTIAGEPLRDRRFFGETTAVCAKSTSASATVIVTAPDMGASAGGGGGGGGGLSVQDEASFTAGTSNFTPSGGVYNDGLSALNTGQQAMFRMSAQRELHTIDSSVLAALQAPIASCTTGNCANNIGNTYGPSNVTVNDCGGTITTGGTAQNAFTASSTKHGFQLRNLSTSEILYYSLTTTASTTATTSAPLYFATTGSESYYIGVGPNTALSVIATTTSHPFYCIWW